MYDGGKRCSNSDLEQADTVEFAYEKYIGHSDAENEHKSLEHNEKGISVPIEVSPHRHKGIANLIKAIGIDRKVLNNFVQRL